MICYIVNNDNEELIHAHKSFLPRFHLTCNEFSFPTLRMFGWAESSPWPIKMTDSSSMYICLINNLNWCFVKAPVLTAAN